MNELKNYCECFYYPLTVKVLEHTNFVANVKKRMNDGVLQLHAGEVL